MVKLKVENTRYLKTVNKSFENLDKHKKPNLVHENINSRQIRFREYLQPFGTEYPNLPYCYLSSWIKISRTVTLLAVLDVCETWSQALREENMS